MTLNNQPSNIRFDILTIFPDYFESPFRNSLLSKGIKNKIIDIGIWDIRKFGKGRHKQVDDRPFGGGPGMVLRADILQCALKNTVDTVKNKFKLKKPPYVISLDPSGIPLKQRRAIKLAEKSWVILICGHYEGIDERFKELFVNEEISIGDYVLNGGEAAALVLIETISRLIPGFLGKKESLISESFSEVSIDGKKVSTLDYPSFTRPEIFAGKNVPKVLLSGNHKQIEKWRTEQSLIKTRKKRPDLLI